MLSKDTETTKHDLLKDVVRIRDNVPQDASSDIYPFHVLGSPRHIYHYQES